MSKKKTPKDKGEEIIEVFEVENKKTGEEKQIVKKSESKENHANKDEKKRQEKQLRNILITLGIFILIIVLIFGGLNMIRKPQYKNTKFLTVNEGDLIFYQTSIPTSVQGKVVPYNFYLRTNPRKLKNIPFEGDLTIKKGYVLNLTDEFGCDGFGIISIANLMKQQEIMGITLINDKSASCDEFNRYNYYEIKEGDETKIVQRGESSCYDIYVNNCEILEATEKLMVENFVKFNE
jgi:hypothetical protein